MADAPWFPTVSSQQEFKKLREIIEQIVKAVNDGTYTMSVLEENFFFSCARRVANVKKMNHRQNELLVNMWKRICATKER